MTAKELYYVTQNHVEYGGNRNAIVDSALKQFSIARCYHPLKVKVFDSHLGQFVERKVPCGCCYHCRETKQNEWVTRLYAHCEDYKYIYFITLTYRSFDPNISTPYIEYIKTYLNGAYWHRDSFNELHRDCLSPCVLYKHHYQTFLKRLRKNTNNNNLTYLLCGEYGSKFARPHFHAILFSRQPISDIDIRLAWGLRVSLVDGVVKPSGNGKNPRFLPFGRIDFHDLVENGTLSAKKFQVDGQNMSARKCFAYVAKYCVKRQFNDTRIKYYFNDLQDSVEDYEKDENNRPETLYYDFRKDYRPFITVSRGTPIGSLWLERHIKEYAEGNTPRPPLQTQGVFIVPSYFRRKASECVYSLRSISPAGCIGKGNLPNLANALSAYVKDDFKHLARLIPDQTCETIQRLPFNNYHVIEQNTTKLLNSSDCFIDIRTKHRFLIAAEVSLGNCLLDTFVCEYAYNKSLGWKFVCTHSLATWCSHYLSQMPADFACYLENLKKSQESEYYYKLVEDYYTLYDRIEDFYEMPFKIEKENDAFFAIKDAARYNNSKL